VKRVSVKMQRKSLSVAKLNVAACENNGLVFAKPCTQGDRRYDLF
jgi:hypothetical protein